MSNTIKLKEYHLYLTRKSIAELFEYANRTGLEYGDIESDFDEDTLGISSLMRKAVRLEDELRELAVGELRVELVNLYGSRITNEDLCYIGGMTVPELEYAIQEAE